MEAGKLRHRIGIERLNHSAQDPSTGDIVQAWEPLKTVYAAVEPVSGREFIQSAATQAQISVRITIRSTDVQPADRIAHKGLLYNIHAVLPDRVSGQDYLTLMCSQGVNDG